MTAAALKSKSKRALIEEVEALRRRVAELEARSESADDALRRSEERFRRLFETIPGALMILDRTGHIGLVNEQVEAMFGYRRDELVGMQVETLLPERFREAHQGYRTAFAAQPDVRPMGIGRDLAGRRKDGTEFPVEIGLSYIETEEGILSLAFVTDITERKRGEEIIEYDAMLLANVSDAIISADTQGRIVSWNKGAEGIYGWYANEAIGKDISDFLKTEYADNRDRAAIGAHLVDEGYWYGEIRQLSRDGKHLQIQVSSRLLRDSAGNIIGSVSINQDITRRKKAEQVLRESEEELQTLFYMLPVGVSLLNNQGQVMQLNPALEQIMEMSPGELLEGAFRSRQYIRRDGTPMSPMEFPSTRALAEQQVIRDVEVGIVKENGETLWVSVTAAPVGLSRASVVTVTMDITERMAANENLRKANERFSKTFRSSPIGISISTLEEGRYIDVNTAFLKMYGFERREDLIGKTSIGLRTWVNSAQRATIIEELRSNSRKSSFPLRFRHQSGEERDALCAVEIIELDGEECIVSMIQDITDLQRAEAELERHRQHLEELVEVRTAELKKANDQLTALSQIKDEFVSNVSHELRTPITSLLLRHNLLKKTPERLEYHLDSLERDINRLHRTIEELLQLSRLDRKQTELKRSRVNINDLVGAYVSDRLIMAEAKNLHLAFLEESKLPEVLADAGLLEQTLGILLTNAINYTPAGGSITVQTLTEAERQWVGFSISDTGPGISPEDQSKLFQRFFRGRVGRASQTAGTGLGLAIAKEIIERHAGWIEVESSGVFGEGACFTVWLPAQG
jgi:PAS domain S-box-containing protein